MRLVIERYAADFGRLAGMSEIVRERCLFGQRYRTGMNRPQISV